MQEQKMIIFDNVLDFEDYINNIKVRTEEKIIENELIWNQYDGNGTKEEYIEKIKNLIKLTINNNQKMFSDCLFLLKCHEHQEFELIKISYIINLKELFEVPDIEKKSYDETKKLIQETLSKFKEKPSKDMIKKLFEANILVDMPTAYKIIDEVFEKMFKE
ncbi:MAG: hypothetical protein IKP65_06730 [Alphaproteobacteria bacterium]|nr:hypothetical protein [Alphaproteobacteria bacterium]